MNKKRNENIECMGNNKKDSSQNKLKLKLKLEVCLVLFKLIRHLFK